MKIRVASPESNLSCAMKNNFACLSQSLPEIINLSSCSTQLSMKFQRLISIQISRN